MSRLRWILIGLGLPAAAAGVLLDHRPLVFVAIGFLGAAVILRIILNRRQPPQ